MHLPAQSRPMPSPGTGPPSRTTPPRSACVPDRRRAWGISASVLLEEAARSRDGRRSLVVPPTYGVLAAAVPSAPFDPRAGVVDGLDVPTLIVQQLVGLVVVPEAVLIPHGGALGPPCVVLHGPD